MKRYFLSLAAALLAGLAAYFSVACHNEVAAANRIRRIGGAAVWTDFGPRWLANVMGRAYPFKSVTVVMFGISRITDADLENILPLKHVEYVVLNGADVRGTDLSPLRDLPSLRSLDLTGAKMTDDTLKCIGTLTNLEWLSLGRTSVTDQNVSNLFQLRHLGELDLSRTKVTDLCLGCVSNLPLTSLDVRNTMITSNGVANIKKVNPSIEVVWGP